MTATLQRRPLVIAHRGGAGECPENTWQAFRAAVRSGVTHIETDAQLTLDGIVVLSHDSNLLRTFNIDCEISAVTWDELIEVAGDYADDLMRLDAVLDEFPDTEFTVDAKSQEVALPLAQLVVENNAQDRVILASFNEGRLECLRQSFPDLMTSLGTSGVARLVLAAKTGHSADQLRVPAVRRGVRAAQVPEKYGPVTVVDRRFVATAHQAGLEVHVWTVNSEEQMRRLIDLGVDGIITDYPTLARKVIADYYA